MKKFLIGVLFVVLAVLGIVLVAPSLIDWNRYKDEIAYRVSVATGRTLTIAGDLDLTVLPRPTLRATGARLANLPGAAEADMVRIGELRVRVALMPLLSGQIQVESITLVEPVVALETLPDGRRNWQFGSQPSGFLDTVRLDQVRIERGTVVYRDDATGAIERFESIDASIVAGSLVGPFQIQAGVTARGVPFDVEVSAGRVGEGGALPLRASVRLRGTETVLRFAGIATTGPNARLQGDLRAEGADLRRPLGAVLTAAGRGPAEELPRLLQQSFNLRTSFTASARLVELNGVELQVGETRGSGSMRFRPGSPESGSDDLELTLNVNRLDLDAWLALRPAETQQGQGSGSGAVADNPGFTLPTDLGARLTLGVDAIGYRGSIVRQARLEGQLADGVLTLARAGASLPGGSELSAAGTIGAADGWPEMALTVEATSDNLRALLEWAGIDVARVPADRLRKSSLAGTLTGTPQQLQLSGVDLRVDTTVASGAVSFANRERPAFGARLEVDRLNLDAYLPQDGQGGRRFEAGWLSGFDATLDARFASLTLADTQVQDLQLDATLASGSLTLRRAEARDVAGANLSLTGTIASLSPLGGLDLGVNAAAESVAPPLRRLGIEAPVPPDRLGRVTVQGRMTGSLDRLGLELDAAVSQGRLQVGGAVDRPFADPTWDVKLRGTWPEGRSFARLFWPDWRPAELGTLDVYAEIGGTAMALSVSGIQGVVGPMSVTGEATVDLAGERPQVQAQLATGELMIDRYLEAPVAGARPRSPLGVALAIAPPQNAELRLTVNARALAAGEWRVDEPSLTLVAAPGAWTLERLEGGFRGGRLGLDGRIARNESGRAELGASATVTGATLQDGLVPGPAQGQSQGQSQAQAQGQGQARIDLAGGRYDLSVELSGEGAAEAGLLRSLDGRGRFLFRDGTVTGLDLGQLAPPAFERLQEGTGLARGLRALLDKALSSGSTPVERVETGFTLQDGVIATEGLSLASPAGSVTGGGRIDTVERRVDLNLEVRPAGLGDLPPPRVAITGPLAAPQRAVAADELEAALAQRAEAARRARAEEQQRLEQQQRQEQQRAEQQRAEQQRAEQQRQEQQRAEQQRQEQQRQERQRQEQEQERQEQQRQEQQRPPASAPARPPAPTAGEDQPEGTVRGILDRLRQ
ncbi:AsmA family protein [Arenibaculum pallidiluteum]|uniref:AsmA family protein n=1 Tax=Arenibaculum pallidiluteum TaxID=2812559 RepID=UPI001A9748F9|nr:AsmA family protein [Arenibaculum pallidiluteum]